MPVFVYKTQHSLLNNTLFTISAYIIRSLMTVTIKDFRNILNYTCTCNTGLRMKAPQRTMGGPLSSSPSGLFKCWCTVTLSIIVNYVNN